MDQEPSMKLRKLRLTNPWVQNFISGMCLFLAVGIYLAITGLGAGAGRQSSADVAMTTNAILYAVFTASGFFGGSVLNTIGPKLTYTLGIFGYPLYASGLWYYDATGQSWYPLLSGAVLGVCAGLLWTVAGFIQFCYGEEGKKGAFIAMQTFLLAAGSTVGSSIPLGINVNNVTDDGVPTSVYAAFVSIMTSAMLLSAFCIVDPRHIIREDGTRLARFQETTFQSELAACVNLLNDWRIVALLLPMFSTEIMLAIIPTLNAFSCNLRTRSLNNFVFQAIQMPSSYLLGMILDRTPLTRRKRGLLALAVSSILTATGWCLAIFVQVHHHLTRDLPSPQWDWTGGDGYPLFLVVVLIFGIIYAINQMVVMWTLSALTNEPAILARYAGLYKAMLSAGLCVTFGLAATEISYLNHTIIQTVLMIVSLPIVAFIIFKCVKDTKYLEEENVIPPEKALVITGLEIGKKSHEPDERNISAEGKGDSSMFPA